MVKRRVIRVLAVQNPVLYAVDRGREVGITYETMKAFEAAVNRQFGKTTVKIHVVMLPVPRDELLSRLEKGEGDIAAAALRITSDRKTRVAFSQPFATGITDVLVTAPGTPALKGLDDVSGLEGLRPSLEQLRRAHPSVEPALRQGGQDSGRDHPGPRNSRGRRHPGDGERGPGARHGREQLHRGSLPPGVSESRQANEHSEQARRDRVGFPEAEPEAGRDRQRLRQGARPGLARRQFPHHQVPEEHPVGEERPQRRGSPEVPVHGRPVSEVQPPVRASTTS